MKRILCGVWVGFAVAGVFGCTPQPVSTEQAPVESVAVVEEEPSEPSEESGLVRVDGERRPGEIEFAGQEQVQGVMQVFWLQGERHVRFLVDTGSADHLPEIDDEFYDRTPSILGFHEGRDLDTGYLRYSSLTGLAGELVQHIDVPENFLRYEEGHVEVPGTLTFRGLVSLIECDAAYTVVEYESFEAMPWSEESRAFVEAVLAQPRRVACGDDRPWEESFWLSDGQAILAEPAEGAEAVAVPSMPVVIKVRTVDEEWIEVYSYADPDLRGFVRAEDLEPVN